MTTSYVISGLPEGARFYFVVQAYNIAALYRLLSAEVSGIARSTGSCAGPPGVPNLSANAVGRIVNLAWSAGEGASPTAYRLFVGSRADMADFATVDFAAIQRSLSSAVPFGQYFVRLIAVNPCGSSTPSTEHALNVLRPASLPPDPPSQPVPEWTEQSLTLRWSPAATGGEVEHFVLEVLDTEGQVLTTFNLGNKLTYSGPLPSSGVIVLRLRAVNNLGTSAPSPELLVMLPQ